MTGALSGTRVLDLSCALAEPWAGQVLDDLGAGVINIERPGTSDETRAWEPPYLKDAAPMTSAPRAARCVKRNQVRSPSRSQ